ncbi:sigma-70 family RNA polymerase sigma factor [Duganella sp. FT109W]|uniref:Sigma-70 family RNA polymerase sigma factor n=1 Tax=Duganella margarita TaxID=2692170 RepID=A0A7X4GXE1_9BURK|nr:sigma-70 family RNA polymerase sigma factor [Duganella margarita]MYM70804.1 sigma-70 family RNA polymerase sigma factor [Duganella margarita]MYN38423.1 sigma-70 family RNA polymerase sigma factor [Duganella margarita]
MPSSPDLFDYDAVLAACAQGDQHALHRLYQQDGRHLLGVALRIVRRRDVAEDVLHDAFVSIWQKAASFDAGRGAGRGWVYSVVRHQALNALRGSEREVAADSDLLDALQEAQADTVVEQFELQATMGRLHECLAHLDSAKRNSIVCAYVDGCSHREIAERLKAPLGSVKAWLKRGLAALRECMG